MLINQCLNVLINMSDVIDHCLQNVLHKEELFYVEKQKT